MDIGHVHEFVRKYKLRLDEKSMTAHSPLLAIFGTMILWFAWLLFNGGSSNGLSGDGVSKSSLAMVNSILSPSAAGIFTLFTR